MQAPAPASALVYGSTYVASGVYVVARIYPILTVDAHLVIAIVGCISLLMGALIALVQTNIKLVLAWSTISQLGYMMLFLGAGCYTGGLVHLFTHAFFNACLFLCAASVIHALDHEHDLRQMGGLWRKLPLTALAFLLATLALIGVPFFSGAYSKMLGLAGVYEYAHVISSPRYARAAMCLFYIPAVTSFITAFYMGRCWWLIFAGKSRNEDRAEQAHERFLMVLPIAILALLSINFYEFFLLPTLISKSIAGVQLGGPPVIRTDHTLDHARQILSLRAGGYATWGFLGALPAILLYNRGFAYAERLRRLPLLNLLHIWLRESMFFDALYNGMILKGLLIVAAIVGFLDRFLIDSLTNFVVLVTRSISVLAGNIDQHFIDGGAAGLGHLTRLGAKAAVAPHGGRLRIYLLVMFTTLAVVTAALVAGFYAL
jgi:NADH-quinone oxidoreductase subunit L